MEPFHFDSWMVSLVRWKPVLEPNYPSKIIFWVRVLDLPLQFRAAETLQSVGQAIGTVQGQMDLIGGRIRVEVDGFKPLVFSVTVEFEQGVEVTVALRYEKLFGFCRECYMLTHEQSRCPALAKEDTESFMVGGSDGDGAAATSYKAVVANDTKQFGERREAHYNRSQAGRGGDKGKGIVREPQGVYRQEGSFHPYKGKHPRGYGDGASYQGRYTGYGDRRMGMQFRGPQQQQLRNDERDQLLQDPNKLMLGAFKGVRRSPVAGTVNKVGPDGTGASSSKARKTLLFEEPASTIQIGSTDQDVVAVGDTPNMQEIPVEQKQGEVEEETKLAEERSLHSQALDEANLMVDGVLLSDSELLLEEGDDQEDWEQGEIMDFTEEELASEDQGVGDQTVQETAQFETDKQVAGEGDEEKDTRKKGPMLEPAATGGSKKRGGQSFVSPRKKLLAKVAAKQGDKGIKKAPPKAKNSAA
ncbi:uncharacterized protein LOC103833302 [Brassica rapa]|uniref:uncharacterized protein LOC103833302 n=1 Tax=Brassica campestris TaxID=3711 RepID=UPI00142E0849|nr:uncharacterized protein LOC103833302 [Brassica rapa]XP_009107639.2 uncharacterized protein LOC103833302 [Brassica rapa]